MKPGKPVKPSTRHVIQPELVQELVADDDCLFQIWTPTSAYIHTIPSNRTRLYRQLLKLIARPKKEKRQYADR